MFNGEKLLEILQSLTEEELKLPIAFNKFNEGIETFGEDSKVVIAHHMDYPEDKHLVLCPDSYPIAYQKVVKVVHKSVSSKRRI